MSPVAISTAPTGMAATIGMATTIGTAASGIIIGEIITADGVGGTAIGGAIRGTTLCSSAVLASHGGGVGAGAHGRAGVGAAAGDTRTATVTTAVTLITAAAIPITATATDMKMGMTMDMATATATDIGRRCKTENTEAEGKPESPSCNDGCRAPAITMGLSTEFWGRKPAPQSGPTSKSTVTSANRCHS